MSNIPDETASSFYNDAPKAVLDPTGDYIFWTANLNTDRLFAFVAQVPWHLLVSEADYNPNGPFAQPITPRAPTASNGPSTQAPTTAPGPKPAASIAATKSIAAALAFIIVLLF